MVRRLGLGKNNHLTYASLALNPRDGLALYAAVPYAGVKLYFVIKPVGISSMFKTSYSYMFHCIHFLFAFITSYSLLVYVKVF